MEQPNVKPLPVGRNWQWSLGEGFTLLRNTNSVEPRLDGWWLCQPDRATTRVEPEMALLLLRGLRAVRQP